MPEWMLVVIGLLIAAVLLVGVIWIALRPPKQGKKPWLAPPSGQEPGPTGFEQYYGD